MRLNNEYSQVLFTTFEDNKGVSRVSFTKEDIDNLCYTINAINGAKYGVSIIGNYFIADYEIPTIFSELIVPVRIKFNAEDNSFDFKSSKYAVNDMKSGQLLDPHGFTTIWSKIMGCMRIKSSERKSVRDLRADAAIATLDKRMYPDTDEYCLQDGGFMPIAVTTAFYEVHEYTMEVSYVFKKWLDNTIIKARA